MSADPDHEPFSLVDLFQSPHRPTVPVWVNNVMSISVYGFLFFLLCQLMLTKAHETYAETEISQFILRADGNDARRTRKQGVTCNCLSKLSALVDVEDEYLAGGKTWTIISDIALSNADRCNSQFDALAPTEADVVEYYRNERTPAYGFCYSAQDNRTWAPLTYAQPGACRDALDGTTAFTDVSNLIAVRLRICPGLSGGGGGGNSTRRLQTGNGPGGSGGSSNNGGGGGNANVGDEGGGPGEAGSCYENATAALSAWTDVRAYRGFCAEFDDHPPFICSWYRHHSWMTVVAIAYGSTDFVLTGIVILMSLCACTFGEARHTRRKGVKRVVNTLVTGRRLTKIEAGLGAGPIVAEEPRSEGRNASPRSNAGASPRGNGYVELALAVQKLQFELAATQRALVRSGVLSPRSSSPPRSPHGGASPRVFLAPPNGAGAVPRPPPALDPEPTLADLSDALAAACTVRVPANGKPVQA